MKQIRKREPADDGLCSKHYHVLQNIAYYFSFYRENSPVFLWLCLAEIVFGAIWPYFGIWLPKLAVELVTEGVTTGRLLLVFGVSGLLGMCVSAAQSACKDGKYFLYNFKRNLFIGNIFLKSLRIPYRCTEEGKTKELYWKASGAVNCGDWSAFHKMTYGTVDIIKNTVSFLLYSTVLGFLSPWVALFLIVISLLQYAVNMSRIRYMERFRGEGAELSKRNNYVFYHAMGNEAAAKDVRLCGMKGWLSEEKERLLDWNRKFQKKRGDAEFRYSQLGSLLSLGRSIFAYVYLLEAVAGGSVGAGDFVLYFGAITGFSGFVGSIMDGIAELRQGNRDTNLMRAYLELPEDEEVRAVEESTDGDAAGAELSAAGAKHFAGVRHHISELTQPISIEFRDVSFSYRDGERIFDRLSLRIEGGEKLALVGINGAGKTTLIKLLCGMYEPDEGTILFNGIDYREFPKKELYRLFSAVFQEKFILPFTVGENLALSGECDEKRAWKALEDAGLEGCFRERGITLDSYFDKEIDERGIELSGGEEQRFLLARALYKDAPILLLDEPTAALDPIAESEVYDQYSRYAQGKTAVFVSHRLASTRFSDRIVLLGDGRILEEGSHEELLERGGAYAEMFRVQSRYYARNRLEKEAFE